MKTILRILILTLSLSSVYAQTGRRLEVLFLGDKGHHKPYERLPSLMSSLGPKGINFTYTEKLEDLNNENLSKYDALLLYANIDAITPAAEKALLDFVASGKGFLPIHCASYCFRNSPEMIKLMGGQFWRHSMDSVTTVSVQPNHFIMNGLKPFTAYDETYLHTQLQPDNNILATREIKPDQAKDKPDTKTEPYTWTRTHGKGKVFYTAYGHDERTWEQPGFQDLIFNAIVWAVNDDAKMAFDARKPEPFTYREAKLPNYEKRPGEQLQQNALSPEESMKHMQIPIDFDLQLFAAEPNVQHPIAMAWDEKGRLYVLITKDYPNERKESGGSDFILICEDTNKDGKADKFTRFAEGLSIPTGLVFANGGLIVSQAPHMLFLKDTDGDDKADQKKILFSGFGTGDTHAGPSNLHYGFDNWIWGCVGYSGFKGKFAGSDTLKFGQAFFRFKPDGSNMEWMTSTSNNTWGLAFNETGDVFGSTANNAHGWYMAISHKNFLNPSYNQDNGSRNMDTHKDMKTITPKVRQVDVFGGFTAASGHNFYTARAFPKHYWNRIAFVTEPTGHIVHQNNIIKKGTVYEDEESINLMAGADEWFSPVYAQVGPDGAVWVADWYSFIIQHNPKPDGFTMGLGNAYETDLRDYTHGRIYRVGYKKAPDYVPLSLSINNHSGLLAALKSNNMFWRMHAQRLLVERANLDVVPELLAILNTSKLDEAGINTSAIHVLRTLEGLNAVEDEKVLTALINSLKNECAGVRKNAVQILPRNLSSLKALLANDMLNDADPHVQLNTLLAMAEMPQNPEADQAILNKIDSFTNLEDVFMVDALAIALNSHKQSLLKKALANPKVTAVQAAPVKKMDHSMHQMGSNTNATLAADKPDLLIENIIFEPANPTVRGSVTMKVAVKNNGQAIEKGTVIPLNIRIEGQGRKSEIVSQNFKDGIAAGQTIQITKNTNGPWSGNISFGTDIAGEYTVSAAVDRSNQIVEANEKNNSFSTKLSFSLPKNTLNYAVSRAVKSYTSINSFNEVLPLLTHILKMDAEGSALLMKGVADGWNPKMKIDPTAAQKSFIASLEKGLKGEAKEHLERFENNFVVEKNIKKDPSIQVIVLKSVPEAMKFDKAEFTVNAGQAVELVFENPDAMQHNVVIGRPGSLQVIGKAANKMITQKDAAAKNYVPAIPQVLFASTLVNPGQTIRLKFIAPKEAGSYPFICTFPGHWSIMNGVMKVK